MTTMIYLTLGVCCLFAAAFGQTNQWIEFNQMNYMFVPKAIIWQEARQSCLTEGGELVSILNENERDWVRDKLQEYYMPSWTWNGLFYTDRERWTWSDGSPSVREDFWRQDFPNGDGYYMCGANVKETGEFRNEHCSDKRAFTCKAPLGPKEPLTLPPTAVIPGYCPPGWIGDAIGNLCFKLVHLSKLTGVGWEDAMYRCRAETDGRIADLASVHNVLQNSGITAMMANDTFGYWIGLHRFGVGYDWDYADNTPFDYSNWGPGEPTYSSSENCVEIWHQPYGTWNNLNCNEKRGYICQTYKDPDNVMHTPEPTPQTECAPGYTWWVENCYKLYTELRDWYEAEEACKSDGGHLTSINCEKENAALMTKAYRLGQKIWIGFKDAGTGDVGEYKWSDNWNTFYTNWGVIPSENRGGCVAMDADGKWYDSDCEELMASFCKVTSVEPMTTPRAKEGSCPGHEVGQQDWLEYGDHCYYFSKYTKNWALAQSECHKLHEEANLVSIHDEPEMRWITARAQEDDNNMYKYPYWTGLYLTTDNTHSWIDKEVLQYENWAPHEPNGQDSDEHCVQMLLQNYPGKWADVKCTLYNRYICKVGKQPVITEPPHIEGECPEGWTTWGSHCYHFEPDVKVVYTYAEEQCKKLHSSATLASIHGLYESQFIQTQMAERTHQIVPWDYWIGLGKSVPGTQNLAWSDGSPLDYVAWASGQPTDYSNNQNCVKAQIKDTLWRTEYCYPSNQMTNAYVCKLDIKKTYMGLTGDELAGAIIGGIVAIVLVIILILFLLDRFGVVDVRKKADDTKKLITGFVNPNFGEAGEGAGPSGSA